MSTVQTTTALLTSARLLAAVRPIEGWLADDEIDLLAAAATRAIRARKDPAALVEIGSFCGRSTTVLGYVVREHSPRSRVYAVDPHEGLVGALGAETWQCGPTFDKFIANLAANNLLDFIVPVRQASTAVAWSGSPISLLFVDGLHDAESVRRDFAHFQPWLDNFSLIAFHDYSSTYPGVVDFVDELLHGGSYASVELAGSLHVLGATRRGDERRLE